MKPFWAQKMQVMEMGGMKSAFFPADLQNGIGGCIVQGSGLEPSNKGTLVYLNGGDDLAIPLAKVEKEGCEILLPKTAIGQNGFMAHFIDTERNKVALHSLK